MTANSPAFTHLVDLSLEKVQRAAQLYKEYAWSIMAAFLWPFVHCNKDLFIKAKQNFKSLGADLCSLLAFVNL